jgi:GDPmannose 4,6-dehydratase
MGARRALITGITGQDGSFLAELLLQKGYAVTGTVHGDPEGPLRCSEHLRESLSLIGVDLLRPESLETALLQSRPHELYHLAAPSFVPWSWQRPAETLAAIAGSTATLLQAVREHMPATRFFHASSGAMFGSTPESPQQEDTPCRPQTPYATAKLAAHQLVGQMRSHDGLFACSGILYNHESERRPEHFVTRKIARAAAQIKLGLAEEVVLGDLHAVRDWSFAGDVMQGAWLMLQQEQPGDYVLASGVGHTVAQLAQTAFAHVGLDAESCVRIESSLMRGREPTPQVGDPRNAADRLGWRQTLSFEQLVDRMVDADLQALQVR